MNRKYGIYDVNLAIIGNNTNRMTTDGIKNFTIGKNPNLRL